MKKLTFIFYIVIFISTTQKTSALAGFSEFSTKYYFGDNYILENNTPSDSCPPEYGDQNCIDITLKGDRYYQEIPLLISVNNIQNNYIIGQTYKDKKWIIYDLKNKKIVIENIEESVIKNEGLKLGINNLNTYSTDKIHKILKQTEESKKQENEDFKLSLVIFFIPIAIIFLMILYFKLTLNKKPK